MGEEWKTRLVGLVLVGVLVPLTGCTAPTPDILVGDFRNASDEPLRLVVASLGSNGDVIEAKGAADRSVLAGDSAFIGSLSCDQATKILFAARTTDGIDYAVEERPTACDRYYEATVLGFGSLEIVCRVDDGAASCPD